ncbi:MAG: acyloxyacyl hydrolase [Bacteroidota bacterium]
MVNILISLTFSLVLKFIATLLTCVAILPSLNAQFLKGTAFETSFHYGRILKHTPKFEAAITGKTYGIEFNLVKNTYGAQPWQQLHKYPIIGYALSYFNFGDNEIWGSAVAVMPNFTLQFLKKKHFHMHFRLGTGIAFLSKPFDKVSNPTNNVIGSHLNNVTAFRLGFGWHLTKQWTLQTSGSYTHFSNGGTTQPNLGINVPSLNIGLKYTPQPVTPEDLIHYDSIPAKDKKIHFDLGFSVGFRESRVTGGPPFPHYIGTFTVHRMINRVNRLHLGFEYEYPMSQVAFIQHVEQFETRKESRLAPMRFSIQAADEVILGRVSFMFILGAYLTQNDYQSFWVYAKLGTRYYIPFGKPGSHHKVHFGLYMKSHKAVAEHIAGGVGVQF